MNNGNPLISICIPAYEANGNGVEFISRNIASCLEQTYDNIEIIVSDHSKTNEIEILCASVDDNRVKFIKNPNNIGHPACNTNNAIKNSNGSFIKIMNLDDFFLDSGTISRSIEFLKTYNWVVFACANVDLTTATITGYHYPRHPSVNINLLRGINTIGSPSCSLIPKGYFFDEEIFYMIDCELYYRAYEELGLPGIIQVPSIANGIGAHQLTTKLAEKYDMMLKSEIEYCSKKYKMYL